MKADRPGHSLVWHRLAYVGGFAAVLAVLYSVPESLLRVRDRATDTTSRDPALEFFLWAAVAFAWLTCALFSGSDPGYLPLPESARPATAAHDPENGRDDEDDADMQRHQEDAPHDASALVASIMTIRARNSPSAAATAAAQQASSSSDRDRLADAAEDAYVDYDPIDASRPGAPSAVPPEAAAAAAAAARQAERQCAHCAARQPARAHHCKVCDRCVATFDHHCGVLGTCVGERNRCRFWWFLLSHTCVLALAIGVLNSGVAYRRTWGDWLAANIVALVALVTLWVLQALVGGLLAFHSWLAATNTTTFETMVGAGRLWYLAGTDPRDCDLPYSAGLCGNLRAFCCAADAWRLLAARAAGCCRRGRHAAGGDSDGWKPRRWEFPGAVDREGTNSLWENRYYSCC